MALKIIRAERQVPVLLDGNLLAEWQAVDAAYKDALAKQKAAAKDRRINDPASKRVNDLLKQARQISAKAREQTVTFRISALPRHVWDNIVSGYPDSSADSPLPYNTKKVTDAAMSTEGTIVSVERPDGTKEEFTHKDWEQFSADLSDSQHDDFRVAVINLNAGLNEVPFLPESEPMDDSAASSKPQGRSGSRTAGSSAGSRKRTTSTTKKDT